MPQLGSCTSSGRAWRLWAALDSQEEAGPLGAQPLPRVFERAASKAADVTAFDPPGTLGLTPRRLTTSPRRMSRCGTAMYMAPEVAHRKPYGAASDVYGLGCVLLELLLRRSTHASPRAPVPPWQRPSSVPLRLLWMRLAALGGSTLLV